MLASCGTAAVAGEVGADTEAAIRSAMESASQAVAEAKTAAHKCALSGISNHTVHIADNKIKGNIYNCAKSKGSVATIDIGDKTISSGRDIKTKQ